MQVNNTIPQLYPAFNRSLLEIESNNEETVDIWRTKLGLDNFESVQYWYRKLKEYYNINKKVSA